MTLSAWLDARRPAPPTRLRTRIDAALGRALQSDANDAAAACLRAGEELARELLQENATSRESALDLLAADALVTYAFEAASERPGELVAQSRAAMVRIAALAGGSPHATEP
jgi:uncharacterized membrane protein